MSNIFSREELIKIGFKSIGKNIILSKKSSIYSPEKISIGDNVRIDDFCVLSGNIIIGNNIHIAVFSCIFGGNKGVYLGDFVNISSRVSIYAISDDYSGESMTGPLVPDKYKNIIQKKVNIERHVIIGASSVVLPGACIDEGASFGAFSLIVGKINGWSINVGIPSRKIKNRSKNILKLENFFLEDK
ncbi:MAG: acyltransferase [Oscillospiraceae bacterium]|nr:acyltransferase [Oscillospiraceae bacterium]